MLDTIENKKGNRKKTKLGVCLYQLLLRDVTKRNKKNSPELVDVDRKPNFGILLTFALPPCPALKLPLEVEWARSIAGAGSSGWTDS